ncbi:MAG: DUF1476 domain-containing protein [Rickettsiales bacterium]|nr:DUF1476 domain-containing protein [Rickettsiales bacterium]
MTTFDKREKAFEDKHAHDLELQFKVTARRNKLLGVWAAQKLGMNDADAQLFSDEVVLSDFQQAGDDDVLAKIHDAFINGGISIDEDTIRTHMQNLLIDAKEQLFKEV